MEIPPETPDIVLIQRAAAGEIAAFSEFLKRHTVTVIRFCYQKVGDHHLAEDAHQEAALRFFEQVRTGRCPDEPLTWFLGIARHCCREFTRTSARRHALPLKRDVLIANKDIRCLEMQEEVDRLSDLERTAVMLRHVEGYKNREIAEQLDKPISTIATSLSRAYQKLEPRV